MRLFVALRPSYDAAARLAAAAARRARGTPRAGVGRDGYALSLLA